MKDFMQERDLKLNGVIGYWSLSDGTPLVEVHDGLKAVGLEHCVPITMTDKPSLRRGLGTVFPKRRQLIRPLEGKAGFAVIEESTDDNGDLTHEQSLQVQILYPAHMGGEAALMFRPHNHIMIPRVKEEFLVEKERVPASQLGQILVRCIESLRGVSLRPTGGFYWLAEEDVPKWEEVAKVIVGANASNKMYLLRTTTEPETVDAVCDAVLTQVQSKLDALVEELEHGDLGKRALKSREALAQELDEYLQRYESIFQKSFSALREQADEVESAAAMAIIQAMGASA